MKINWCYPLVLCSSGLVYSSSCSLLVITTNSTYSDRIASFGPRITENGKIGYLMEPLADPTGCRPVQAPTHSDWIALVRRGGCPFITKVRSMQQSGAIAVAVGDPDQQSGWITMYAPGDISDITIPSIFLAKNEYRALLYASKIVDTPMMVMLQMNAFMTWPLLDIMMIIFVSPSIMMIFVYISWQLRQKRRQKQEIANVRDLMSRLELKAFEREKRLENEAEGCAICLEDYEQDETLRVLPCNHNFHMNCVDAWLAIQKKFCPICKRDIDCKNSIKTIEQEQQALLLEEHM